MTPFRHFTSLERTTQKFLLEKFFIKQEKMSLQKIQIANECAIRILSS